MSDKTERELERRWRASGDDADEARVLTARLRAGRLDPDRVVLAAGLEHPPAVQALIEAKESAPLPARLYAAPDLHRALQKVGPEAAVRVSLLCLTLVRSTLGARQDERVEAVAAGLAAWLRTPGPSTRRAVLDARDALEEDVVWEDAEELSSDEQLLRVAYAAAESVLPPPGHVTKVVVNGESLDKDESFVAARHAVETLTLTRELLPHAPLQAGLRAELFPWLLLHASL